MERIKVGKYFFLDEFIDPFTYLNDADNGLSKIDKQLFKIADTLREKYRGALEVNTWWSAYIGGKKIEEIENDITIRKWSGLRTDRCKIGSPTSAHRMGKGMDLKGNAQKMDKIIKDNVKEFHMLGVRRIEDIALTPTWLHIDTLAKNVGKNEIRIITKTTGRNI